MPINKIDQAIIMALSSELPDGFLTSWIYKEADGIKYFQRKNTILVFSGVGKVNAAHLTTRLINELGINTIINIGSCGINTKKYHVGDIFIVNKGRYVDVDATIFKYQLGQIPHEELFFTTDENLNRFILDRLVNSYQCYSASLGTADSFIGKNNLQNFNLKQVTLNDMEGTAILQVASKYKAHCALIKIASDNINNNDSWAKGIESIDQKIGRIINLIVK